MRRTRSRKKREMWVITAVDGKRRERSSNNVNDGWKTARPLARLAYYRTVSEKEAM